MKPDYLRLIALTKSTAELGAIRDAVRQKLIDLAVDPNENFGNLVSGDPNRVTLDTSGIIRWIDRIVHPSTIDNPAYLASGATTNEQEKYDRDLSSAKTDRKRATEDVELLKRFAAALNVSRSTPATSLGLVSPKQQACGGLSVASGATETIPSSLLEYTDEQQAAAAIAYTITTSPASGHVATAAAPATPITSFTQADIDANGVVYVHDGVSTVTGDAFTFSVSDGDGNSITDQVFDIAVS